MKKRAHINPNRIPRFYATLFALIACAASMVRAHTVWIEPKDDRLVIRFAEPSGDFETSPGYLDALTAPAAFVCATNPPCAIDVLKKQDHFQMKDAVPDRTTCAETSFTVRGGRKPVFYARWQPAGAGAATPLLTLDIVPMENEGEARVFFRGKPLGNVPAKLYLPDGKELSLTADADGYLRFKTTAPGRYMLTVPHYREPIAGFHQGTAYTETSHNSSLAWNSRGSVL